MGFRTPDRNGIELSISRALIDLKEALEKAELAVDNLKQQIADAGLTVNEAGGKTFAETYLGVAAGVDNELGKSTEWAQAAVAASEVTAAFRTTLDANSAKLQRAIFAES